MKIYSLFILLIFGVTLSCSSVKNIAEREDIPFNLDWEFAVDSLEVGQRDAWFSSGLPGMLKRTVSLPHTWNIEEGLERYFGTAWYQKSFTVPKSKEGQKVRLKFEAIKRNSLIYLNGKLIGQHIGAGYTTFYCDLTDGLNYGGRNIITVVCDNKFTKQSIPYDWAFDWANDGGIHRGVSLVYSHKNAIDYAHITPSFTKRRTGKMAIKVKILNRDYAERECDMLVHVKEENQITDNTIFNRKITFVRKDGFYWAEVTLPHVKLWHFDSPNLYKVDFKILDNKSVLDSYHQIIGFRSLETKEGKIFFNGEEVELPGIEWMPGSNPDKGFAEDDEEIHKMLTLMKETNSVFTRFHWQQDERIIDWCNRNGILVQEEIPRWHLPDIPTDSVWNSIDTHIDEMIWRDYNAPCIISWGIGNELNGQKPEVSENLMKSRLRILSNLDSTRWVTYTSNTVLNNPGKDATNIGDVLMWNEYLGSWHPKKVEDLGNELEKIRLDVPLKPLVIAEFGLCEPKFTGGDPRRIADMKSHIDYYRKSKNVKAAIYFSLNDYRTHFGESGEGRFKRRIHGVADEYGKKKPSFEKIKEFWSPIEVEEIAKAENGLRVKLRVKDRLPSYTISGYKMEVLKGERIIETVEIPTLKPGEESELSVKSGDKIRILRPTGFLVLEEGHF